MTDINMGIYTANIGNSRTIRITSEKVSLRYHVYENVRMQDLLHELTKSHIHKESKVRAKPPPETTETFSPIHGKKITVQRLFQCVNSFLSNNMVVIVDVGEALIGATDLVMHQGTEFLSPAYYASMGFGVPGSIGSQLARPNLRPLVLVGDGAFQMTGMELSTAVRFNLNPIVIVINNRGYGTERPMLDGPFNDLQLWEFSNIPKVVGGGRSFVIDYEEQLYEAMVESKAYTDGFCILDVRLEQGDMSPALERLTSKLAKLVQKE